MKMLEQRCIHVAYTVKLVQLTPKLLGLQNTRWIHNAVTIIWQHQPGTLSRECYPSGFDQILQFPHGGLPTPHPAVAA